MEIDIVIVLCILLATIILFVTNLFRSDIVAILIIIALGVSKIVPSDQLFIGFANEAVISLIALMIIGNAIETSGALNKIGYYLVIYTKKRHFLLQNYLMLISGLLAGFMRSTGSVALTLPLVTYLNIRAKLPKEKVLLPMAFASMCGSNLTMVGSGPLIILNSLLENSDLSRFYDLKPLYLFQTLPIGLLLLFLCLIYFTLIGNFLMPNPKTKLRVSSTSKEFFRKTYNKLTSKFEVKITSATLLKNKNIGDLEKLIGEKSSIIAYFDGKSFHMPALRSLPLVKGGIIGILSDKDKITKLSQEYNLEVVKGEISDKIHPTHAGLSEAVIPPSSNFIGIKVSELHMKRKFDLNVLSILRGGKTYVGEDLQDLVIKSGDVMGMHSRWISLHEVANNSDFIILTDNYPKISQSKVKINKAISVFALTMLLINFHIVSTPIALLLGAVSMVLLDVLSVDDAYKAVSWKTVFLIAGLIPLGIAMQTTGAISWVIEQLLIFRFEDSELLMQIVFSLLTSILAMFISNIGAAIMMIPMSINFASELGFNQLSYALTTAIAASNTFLIPTNQVSSIVIGPGKYKTIHFIKVGCLMTLMYTFCTISVVSYLV